MRQARARTQEIATWLLKARRGGWYAYGVPETWGICAPGTYTFTTTLENGAAFPAWTFSSNLPLTDIRRVSFFAGRKLIDGSDRPFLIEDISFLPEPIDEHRWTRYVESTEDNEVAI